MAAVKRTGRIDDSRALIAAAITRAAIDAERLDPTWFEEFESMHNLDLEAVDSLLSLSVRAPGDYLAGFIAGHAALLLAYLNADTAWPRSSRAAR